MVLYRRSTLELVSALGPAGLLGAQVALIGAHSPRGLLGIAGLTLLCLMVRFSHQRFGVDRSAKHGSSVKGTSENGRRRDCAVPDLNGAASRPSGSLP